MKISKKATLLLACGMSAGSLVVGCSGDSSDDDNTGGAANKSTEPTTVVVEPTPVVVESGAPQCDEEGAAQCTASGSGIACAAGSTDGVAFSCAVGEECQDGACVPMCEGGTSECVSSAAMRVCSADGRSWVSVQCQAGHECIDGACELEGGLVCVPGTKECEGETARVCNDDGSGWDEQACPATAECVDGACVGSVCTVGAARCNLDALSFNAFFEGDGPGQLYDTMEIIERCVDGTAWVAERCAQPDDGDFMACAYPDHDAAETATYRADMNQEWQRFFENPSQETFDNLSQNWPEVPSVPAGVNAACVPYPDDCDDPFGFFFESPADTRMCADPTDTGDYYSHYSECTGFPLLTPPAATVNSCGEGTICNDGHEQESMYGCVPSDCVPGQARCTDTGLGMGGAAGTTSTFEVCGASSSDTESYDIGYRDYYSCADAGACADVGDGTVTCDDVEVDTSMMTWESDPRE